jgi:DNA repair protein RecO (recombination protein O)
MEWHDEAIVLAARRHGESGLIVQLLTRGHGRHAGLVRGGQGRKLRPVYQVGNLVAVGWKARLAEHLGLVSGELLRPHAARVIGDPARLAGLAAAAALAESALPEREPHARAYEGLSALLESLDADRGWATAYVRWELLMLAELGFGLDLGRCAATGETAGLAYVSPKSGQAVSAAAGAPYRGKLLALPAFLAPTASESSPSAQDVLAGLKLTGYFLDRRCFAPHGRKLPPARARFVDALTRIATVAPD